MIEYDKKKYELKYNLKRVEMIENTTGMPTLAEMQKNRGILSITNLKTYFAFGLKEAGSDTFVIQSEGYIAVNGVVLEALERDCPFFFQAG